MKKNKKQLQEELDILEQTGQESEKKGKKAVYEVQKENERKVKKQEEQFLYELEEKKKQQKAYKEKLLYFLHNMIVEIKFPYGYQWGTWYDGKGIVLSVIDSQKKTHKRAFVPTHEPLYDLNACYMFALWVEDIIDQQLGKLYIPPKIWIPSNKVN